MTRSSDSAAVTLYSLGQLAAELGTTRDRLRNRLASASVTPVTERAGKPLYRLRDALAAFQEPTNESIDPHYRAAHYRAEMLADELQKRRGELIDVAVARDVYLRLTRSLADWLGSLPDNLERAAQLAPSQVEALERRIDEMRNRLHEQLQKEMASGTFG
jgi:hypothetical protein